MKVLLIAPDVRGDRAKFLRRFFYYPKLTLPVLRELTPRDVEVETVDEAIEDIDYESDADLVGISVQTKEAPRAYGIADRFKGLGKKVGFGGYHASELPEEARQHADFVVVGMAENVWGNVISDFQQGKLNSLYIGTKPDKLGIEVRGSRAPKKAIFPIKSVMTSRGCTQNCNHCAISEFHKGYVQKSPDDSIEEIRQMETWFVNIKDAMLIGTPAYKEFFKKLIPLGIKWIGQAPISAGKDEELLDLMAESGCLGLGVGLDTIVRENIKQIGKMVNQIQDYEICVENILNRRIGIKGYFMYGLDNDTPEIFEKTVQFAVRNNLSLASFNILTPYPGTRLYSRLRDEGRLLHGGSDYPSAWVMYDRKHCVFEPKHMTSSQLEEGMKWSYGEFYSPSSIRKRLSNNGFSALQKIIGSACNWGKCYSARLNREHKS